MVSSENNTYADILELLSGGGLAIMGEAIQILLNHAMAAEREAYLDAERHERTPSRKGYANGYKPKKVKVFSSISRTTVFFSPDAPIVPPPDIGNVSMFSSANIYSPTLVWAWKALDAATATTIADSTMALSRKVTADQLL